MYRSRTQFPRELTAVCAPRTIAA